MENQENDVQDVQPDSSNEQQSDNTQTEAEPVVTEEAKEVEALQKEIAERDEKIKNLARKQRELKKEAKKSDQPEAQKQSDELDYGQKSYLLTKEIDESEFGFVTEQLSKSNLELSDMLSNGYFQAELKAFRDNNAARNASPEGEGRGATEPANTKVDYWIDKGELPPNDPANLQLRRDVVNRREQIAKNADRFSSQPIIDG